MHNTPLLASMLKSTSTAAAEPGVVSTANSLLSSQSMDTATVAAAAQSPSMCATHRQERPRESPAAAWTEFCTFCTHGEGAGKSPLNSYGTTFYTHTWTWSVGT